MTTKEYNKLIATVEAYWRDSVVRAREALADRFTTYEQRGRLMGIAEGLLTALALMDCPVKLGAVSAMWEGWPVVEPVE